MSIFDKMFSAHQEQIHKDWKRLTRLEQLNDIDEDSKSRIVVIFKHSTRCGISSMVKYQLESNWDFSSDDMDFYYLDLFSYRPISNAVADHYQVIHQSPQIIVIKNGQSVFDTSHHMVSTATLKEAIQK